MTSIVIDFELNGYRPSAASLLPALQPQAFTRSQPIVRPARRVSGTTVTEAAPGANTEFGAAAAARAVKAARLRLTRRGRLILTLFALAITVPVVTAAAASLGEADARPQEVMVHVVAPGETLWGIARDQRKPGENTRDVVAKIQRFNQLKTTALYQGQTILLQAG